MLHSNPQYILRLRKWGLEKNIRQHEWDRAVEIVRKRKAEGKLTQLTIEDKPVSVERVEKRLRRKGAQSRDSGPSHETEVMIIASTPRSGGSATMATRSAIGNRLASGALARALTVKMPFIQAWESFGSLCKA